MNLIIPAAGKSSRFPGVRPKWMLTHPTGNLVIAEAIRHLELGNVDNIFLVLLKEHVDQYHPIYGIEKAFESLGVNDRLKIVILEQETRSQPETVARAIEMENISGPILIKDSDNSFSCKVEPINSVAICSLNSMDIVNVNNKSYVTLNENKLITNIVEKQVISPYFSVGGYGFENASEYLQYYKKLESHSNLYISHIIFEMLLDDVVFHPVFADNYNDWGTLSDWNRYKTEYLTLFIDIDGVLVKNSGEHFAPLWGSTAKIEENAEIINRLHDTDKVKIILTTARKSEYRDTTLEQLKRENIKYHDIIFDLPHSRRIVINDYAPTNPYKSCDAINIKRNSTDLKEILEEAIKFEI